MSGFDDDTDELRASKTYESAHLQEDSDEISPRNVQ